MKCPSCGFDSPDDAPYCDLCKEPFRRPARRAPAPAAPAVPAPAAGARELPPAVAAQLDEQLALAQGQDKLPAAPPWLKTFAWVFLGIWLATGLVVAGMLLSRRPPPDEGPAPAQRP